MTTVLIVDDSGSIREFLKINLASEIGIQVIGVADNGQAAIAQVEEHQPDIVLMDIKMPGKIDGIEATKIITQRFSQTKILLLTSQDDHQQLNLAIKSGARGYILKNTSVKDISSVIHLAQKGFFQIGPVFGNWDGSLHRNLQSGQGIWGNKVPTEVGATTQYHTQLGSESGIPSEVKHVLSDLTSGMSQLQKTIKSQENTINNLTDQYSQVQQEIRTEPPRSKRVSRSRGSRVASYGYGYSNSQSFLGIKGSRRQHLLYISSFLLGVATVLFLLFLTMTLGGAL